MKTTVQWPVPYSTPIDDGGVMVTMTAPAPPSPSPPTTKQFTVTVTAGEKIFTVTVTAEEKQYQRHRNRGPVTVTTRFSSPAVTDHRHALEITYSDTERCVIEMFHSNDDSDESKIFGVYGDRLKNPRT